MYYSVFDVSEWFLTKEKMCLKKLASLCYYAQAWSYVLHNEILINDTEFQAWVHGAMSPHLYERYKNYDWWDKLAPTGREVIFDKTTLELLHSVYLTHLRKKSPTSKAEGYRRMVFDDNISYRAKEIFEYIAPNYHITLQEWNHDKDHVHILFKAHPKSELSKFISAYKSASSRLLKKEFPAIRQKLWKDHFWSQSFCLLTTGGAPIEVIKSYIESQGEKH